MTSEQETGWIHQAVAAANGRASLALGGLWNAETFRAKQAELDDILQFLPESINHIKLDYSAIFTLDTLGAVGLIQLEQKLEQRGMVVEIWPPENDSAGLLDQVRTAIGAERDSSAKKRLSPADFLHDLGLRADSWRKTALQLFSFIGMSAMALAGVIRHPRKLRLPALAVNIEKTGWRALPIVGLLSFLIGVVLAYQGAEQLRQFGAEIFVVNLLGISILREIGVIMTAIIVAGRSGSAFAAEIGAMKLREELDAMRVMGFDPVEMLVIPRLLALLITLPLLVFFANVMGVFGGAVASWALIDISFTVFIQQFKEAISIRHFWVGLVKAPVFAIVIALVGCYKGMTVSGGAAGVGRNTTESVVIAIFLVILLDALFSVLFQMHGV